MGGMALEIAVLSLTAGHEPAEWKPEHRDYPDYGDAVIRLGRHEVGRVKLTYNEHEDGLAGLEQAAARWMAGEGDSKSSSVPPWLGDATWTPEMIAKTDALRNGERGGFAGTGKTA